MIFLTFRKPWRNDSNPTIIATNACTLPIWSGCLQIAGPTTLRKRNTTTAQIISKNMSWANSGITDSWLKVFSYQISKQIHITSVSGHCTYLIFKICQIIAGTCMICQFYGFWTLYFGGVWWCIFKSLITGTAKRKGKQNRNKNNYEREIMIKKRFFIINLNLLLGLSVVGIIVD